ncbi:MAG: hypothetical protein ACRELF_00775 [Gemmataceae bacterium]
MEVKSDDAILRANRRAMRRHQVFLAGALAFLPCMAFGLVLTVLVVGAVPPKVPNPTEAYEGFGETMTAFFYLAVGAAISLLISTSVAAAVATRVRRRK